MFKKVSWAVVGGVTVALLMPFVTGCSSSGCRSCQKEGLGAPQDPPVASASAEVNPPAPLPVTPTTARPYGGQKTCPVTEEELGAMGKPIAVNVKGQTVYVCCRGCVAKAQADPDKTLAAVAAEQSR